MEKQIYFEKLHLELSSTHAIPLQYIKNIRSRMGGNNTRKEIEDWCKIKVSQPCRWKSGISRIGRRAHSKSYYQELLDLVTSCSPEAWEDITRPTKFDKKR